MEQLINKPLYLQSGKFLQKHLTQLGDEVVFYITPVATFGGQSNTLPMGLKPLLDELFQGQLGGLHVGAFVHFV